MVGEVKENLIEEVFLNCTIWQDFEMIDFSGERGMAKGVGRKA